MIIDSPNLVNDVSLSGSFAVTGSITPGSSGAFDLGSPAKPWRLIYSSQLTGSLTRLSDGTSYLLSSGSIQLSTGSNGAITISTTGASTLSGQNKWIQFNDSGVFGASANLQFDKNSSVLILGKSTFDGPAALQVTGQSDFTGSLMPGAPNTYDLGSTSNSWRDIYVRTGSFSGDVIISGDLRVMGTSSIINSEVVNIKDNAVLLNAGPSPFNFGGVYVADTTANTTGSIIWDSLTDRWKAGFVGNEINIVTTGSTDNLYNKTIPITGTPSNNISGGTQGGLGYFDASGYLKSTNAGSSGQLLQSAGTGVPTWTNFGTLLSGSSVLTGSGTANYLSKFASGQALTNSVIYDDGTNVGVGTSSGLSYKLQVQGTGYFDSNVTVNGSVAAYNIGTLGNLNADTRIGTYSGKDIIFGQGTSGTEFGRFLASGLFAVTGSVEPGTDLTYDLGSSTKRWNRLFANSLSGSHTRLLDGTSYIIAGGNMSVVTGSNGSITLATVNSGTIHGVTAGNGLLGGGTSGTVTLTINDSVVATVSGTTFRGTIKPNQNNFYDLGSTGARWYRGYVDQISGSLTKLVDGTSYLIAGTNVQITTGSNGSVTVANTASGATYVAGSDTQVQFNDGGTFGASSNLTFNKNTGAVTGAYVVASTGFSGSLTRLTDGTSYLIAGGNMSVVTGSNGSVSFATINSGTIHGVTAGNGLLGGGTSGTVSLAINDSIVATVSGTTFRGTIKPNQNNFYDLGSTGARWYRGYIDQISGSLTKLVDGTSYLIAGSNVQITTGSNGSVTVTNTATGATYIAGSDTQLQFNDGGTFGASSNLTFNKVTGALTGTYLVASTGFSGSLTKLTNGTSYLVAGNNITISTGSNGSVTITNAASSATYVGGTDTQVQFNDGGSTFGGDAGLTYNKTTDTLNVTNVSMTATADQVFSLRDNSAGALNISAGVGNNRWTFNTGDGQERLGFWDGVRASFGDINDPDLNIQHDGTNSRIENKTGQLILSGANGLFLTGTVRVRDGISGSLTRLSDGTSYLIAGGNMVVATGSNGSITLSTINSGTIHNVIAGTGLLGGGTSGNVTLSINDSVVATVSGTTFQGTIKPSQNNFYDLGSTGTRWYRGYIDQISGSHTKLVDGTSFLIAGSNVQITTGSNGAVTIAATASGATFVAGGDTQVQFNDGGTFGADGDFTFSKTLNLLRVANISGSITSSNVLAGQVVLAGTGGVLSGSNNFFWNDSSGYVGIGTSTVNSRLTIGNDFASINGIAIDTGGSNDSAIVGRRAVNKTAFGVLPWDTSVFHSAGTYYDGNNWIHHNATGDSQIFELMPASGVRWWASSNSTATFNVANAVTLWDDGARWKSSVQSTRAEVSYFTGGNVGIGTTNTNGNKLAITGGNLSVTGSILPGVTETYDLGSTTYRWRDIYARSGSYTGDVTISGDLIVNGTQFIVNTQVVEIEDNAILLNAGPAPAATGGIYVADTTNGVTGSLLWDSTTDLWKAGKLGSEVTLVSGSGTNNYLTKWNGSNAVGNSVIYDDGTNVGIGLTLTTDKLAVNGSMSVTGSLLPGVNSTYNLGSSSKLWSTVYATNLTGSLTQLANGTSYLIAGSNVTITTGSTGAVTIAAPNLAPSTSAFVTIGNDSTLTNERALTAGTGILLSDGGANSTVTLSINNSVVATVSGTTFTGVTNHNAGLSGSLTRLTNGTSYLIAGANVQITTGSTGAVTITNTATGATYVAGSTTQVQFNDGGTFGADADFTFDKTSNLLRATNISGSLTGSNVLAGHVVVAGIGGVLSGTNDLFWNNTNGRLGIGTSSPGYKLDIPTGDASFYGVRVGRGNASIGGNVVVGSNVALTSVTTGIDLTAIGDSALASNSSGNDNTAMGFGALFTNGIGSNNTAVGSLALFSNNSSANSTAVGYSALGNATGARNTALGSEAGYGITLGTDNILIGRQAGLSITTGNSNTIIGSVAGTAALSNTIILAAGTAERIRIDSNGNVGIGTTLMTDKLAVNGSMSVTGSALPGVDDLYDLGSSSKRWRNLYATSISGSLTGSNVLAGQVVLAGTGGVLSGSNGFFWDNANRYVGIGTTTPAALLTVSGTIVTRYNFGLESYIAAGTYSAGTSGFYPIYATGGSFGSNDTVVKYGAGNNNFVLLHGSNVVMSANVNENVSIGAASYAGRLFVSGSSTASTPTMVVREGALSPTGGTKTFEVQNSVGTSLMYVSGSGEIGIGTDAAVVTSTATTATISTTTLLAVSSTTFRSAEFVLQAVDATGGKYHTAKILAIHNGSITSHTEYGAVNVGGIAGTFDVTNPSAGFFNLQVTPASTNSTVWKVTAILTKA